ADEGVRPSLLHLLVVQGVAADAPGGKGEEREADDEQQDLLGQDFVRGGADRRGAQVYDEGRDGDAEDDDPPAVARREPQGDELRLIAELGEEDQGEGHEKGRHASYSTRAGRLWRRNGRHTDKRVLA